MIDSSNIKIKLQNELYFQVPFPSHSREIFELFLDELTLYR